MGSMTWIRFSVRAGIIPLPVTLRPALEQTHPPIQLGSFHWDKSANDRSDHSPPPSTALGIRGTIPPLHYTSVLPLSMLIWEKYLRLNWIFINLKCERTNNRSFTVLTVFLNSGWIMKLNSFRDGKAEWEYSSEMLAPIHHTTRCHNPEDRYMNVALTCCLKRKHSFPCW
jgi:hypothetical protein